MRSRRNRSHLVSSPTFGCGEPLPLLRDSPHLVRGYTIRPSGVTSKDGFQASLGCGVGQGSATGAASASTTFKGHRKRPLPNPPTAGTRASQNGGNCGLLARHRVVDGEHRGWHRQLPSPARDEETPWLLSSTLGSPNGSVPPRGHQRQINDLDTPEPVSYSEV